MQRLLHSNATFQMQSGEVVTIADIPCYDEDNSTLVKYVDRHNGWGLTALHLAVYKGSKSTGGSTAAAAHLLTSGDSSGSSSNSTSVDLW